MDKYIFDENNGLWYELQGDYYLPCLKLSDVGQILRTFKIKKNMEVTDNGKINI